MIGALEQRSHECRTRAVVPALRWDEGGPSPALASLLSLLVFIQRQLVVFALLFQRLVLIWARLLAIRFTCGLLVENVCHNAEFVIYSSIDRSTFVRT